jgi:hypothetical protein
MDFWDAATDMSKVEWRAACKRSMQELLRSQIPSAILSSVDARLFLGSAEIRIVRSEKDNGPQRCEGQLANREGSKLRHEPPFALRPCSASGASRWQLLRAVMTMVRQNRLGENPVD